MTFKPQSTQPQVQSQTPTSVQPIAPSATVAAVGNPANGGTVSGGGTYAVGSQRQIMAAPNTGWVFAGWSDGNMQNPRILTVPVGGLAYWANFKQQVKSPQEARSQQTVQQQGQQQTVVSSNLRYPVQGGAVTQKYGVPWSENPAQLHTGVDISAKRGQAVYSVADGVVYSIGSLGRSKDGEDWGGYVVVQNRDGSANGYLHLNQSVAKGQKISAGQQVGTIYNNHLHFNQCSSANGCQHGAFPNPTYPKGDLKNYYQSPSQYTAGYNW